MRRKSERTATKKAKASPEKKVEKVKRTRTRRRKQSSSSENESDEGSPVREVEIVEKPEKEAPTTPVKQDSPEEGQDQEQEQVWQVKASESSTDIGEIQKLKICLTRPPSTPERADRSPRSKRKHSRATSSSDTPSTEGEEKRKSRRSKRSRESRDESEKNHDSQGDEPEGEGEQMQEKSESEVSQSTEVTQAAEETPVSTTNDDQKEVESVQQSQEVSVLSGAQNKSSDADTTVNSPEADTQSSRAEINTSESVSPKRDRSASVEKSEVLEIHAEESKHEISEIHEEDSKKEAEVSGDNNRASSHREVSIIQEKKSVSVSEEIKSAQDDIIINNVETDVVESSEHIAKVSTRKMSTDSDKDRDGEESVKRYRSRELERSESTQSTQDEPVHNGQSAPIVVSRKRKWGARPKITTQKSITISTDVLKEIIPDVKPVEFEEVIEEKKHKRIEVTDKVERPLLPKIVIDNTENVEQNRKEKEEKEKEIIKKEPNLAANRRISIVKENDNVVIRPPSPPRHKQSNILYITNLVRPFTLPQLKNLLQRTGRIVENGFWIDRIKSKCFVQYENEDQAVETRHALHGVTWPVSNPKTLQVDFSTEEAFENARQNEDNDNAQTSTIPGTVEDWLREQDLKRERGEIEKPWERRVATREWDVGKNDKEKDKDRLRRDERPMEKRRHRSSERSPEPARKFKKKEEEAPAKLLDDLFRKTKTTPCIYWLPLSAETIAIKEEQRRQHMAEHERRLQELRRTTHRRH